MCANNNFGMIAAQIQHTIQEFKPLSKACNPMVKEMVKKTLELTQKKKNLLYSACKLFPFSNISGINNEQLL